MRKSKLIKILKDNGLSIYEGGGEVFSDKDYLGGRVVIYSYTDGGVKLYDVVENLTSGELIKAFEDFDINACIDKCRQSERHRNKFTVRQSLEDFEKYDIFMKNIIELLKENN